MFQKLIDIANNTKIHSFGQIVDFNGINYTIKFEEIEEKIFSSDIFCIGDYIIFYGTRKDKIICAEYIEKINGIDIKILEDIAEQIKREL